MNGCVYLYFGHAILTEGSFEDLKELGIVPAEGTALTFYDLDADEQDRPTYLCADGVLYLEGNRWHAKVDDASFRSILCSSVNPLIA